MDNYSEIYLNHYLIYIDREGTSSNIKESDQNYGNRKGFYMMAPLYEKPYELAKNIFDGNFIYAGFSDTILILVLQNSVDLIGKLAAEIYYQLLCYGIHSKIIITHGDFGVHNFRTLNSDPNVFISPVYGSTLLNAHQIDENLSDAKLDYAGVFIENNIIDEFDIRRRLKLASNYDLGILDFQKYLNKSEFNSFLELLQINLNLEDIEETKARLLNNHFSQNLIQLCQENNIPEEKIEYCLMADVQKRNSDRIVVKQKILNLYSLYQKHNPGIKLF